MWLLFLLLLGDFNAATATFSLTAIFQNLWKLWKNDTFESQLRASASTKEKKNKVNDVRTKKAQKFNDGNWIFFYWNALCILRVFKRGHSFLLLLLISCCCLLSTFFRVALSLFTFILRFLQLFWLFAFISFFGNYVYQLMEWGNADYLNAKNSK